MLPLDSPRAPDAPAADGLYESHYLTAVNPAGGRALWLRHTALKPPGERPRATVWLTWFDRAAPAPRAFRVTVAGPLEEPGPDWARCTLGRLGPGHASGNLDAVAWSLSWRGLAAPLAYLPARWLYDRRFPRSGGVALAPRAAVAGTLELDGVGRVELDAWEGMVGHNWGSDHPEEWVWLHAGRLGEDGGGWLDLILVRLRLGGRLTPWLAAGALELDGRSWTPSRLRRVHWSAEGERGGRGTVPLSDRARLSVESSAPAPSTVQWDYASPAGPGRTVSHCSVADGELVLEEGTRRRALAVPARMAIEHGRGPGT